MKPRKAAALICATLILSGCAEKTESVTETRELPRETTSVAPMPVGTEEAPVWEISTEDFETAEENGGIVIVRYTGEAVNVVIPAEVGGKSVVGIGEEAFYENRTLESVVIPDGVTVIGAQAFFGCERLSNLVIPESVTEFGWTWNGLLDRIVGMPFEGTPWLSEKRAENPLVIVNGVVLDGKTCAGSVTIPDGTVEILAGAFQENTEIESVTIPDGVLSIGEEAFFGCTRLKEAVLPDSVASIGNYAFMWCDHLENVVFPNRAVEMGRNIFSGNIIDAEHPDPCPWICRMREENPLVIVNGNLLDAMECDGEIVVPDGVLSICPSAFSELGLNMRPTGVRLPEGITRIPAALFQGCRLLESVTIPDSVTEIGEEAFFDCQSLARLVLPDGLEKMGGSIFSQFDRCEVVYRGETYSSDRYDELYALFGVE